MFYVTDGGLHGLEAAPSDVDGIPWGCLGTAISGADGTAIGTGWQNTQDIVAGCADSGIAAKIANDLSVNGFINWFLPSLDELTEMYNQRDVVGFVPGSYYWSSSEDSATNAWNHQFITGGICDGCPYSDAKTFSIKVRAVRVF